MLKKFLCVILTVCVLLSFGACKKNNRMTESLGTLSFISVMLGDKNIEKQNENNVICNVAWNKLKLSGEDEMKFPELKKAFDKLNGESFKNAKAQMNELSAISKELSGEENNSVYIKSETKVFIQRADTKIISYLEENIEGFGGEQSENTYTAKNLNPVTGENIRLADVITSTKGLPHVVEKALTDKYDFLGDTLWDTLSGYSYDDYIWTLDYQGITFWFNPFEIAEGRMGLLSAKLYFDENPNIFIKEYMTAPYENYAISLPLGSLVDFDLNESDNQRNTVFAEKKSDMYGSYYMFSTVVNGETYTDEINYGYDFTAYLVHMGNKNYIYSELYTDNDYHIISTIDLNGEKIEKTSELDLTAFYCEYTEEDAEEATAYHTVLNDVRNFKLQTRFDILGTRTAVASYKASEATGAPEMTDDAYTFIEGHPVTLKTPLKAEILPDMAMEELGEGMNLTPYQTDGKTYIDLETENGYVVRFKIDVSGWPKKVNGIPEDECFSELFYAG